MLRGAFGSASPREFESASGVFESEGFSVPPLPVESSLLPASDESESAAPSDVFESEGLSVPPLPVESSLPPASDESESAAPSDVFESEGLGSASPSGEFVASCFRCERECCAVRRF